MQKILVPILYTVGLLVLPACHRFYDNIQPSDNLPISAVYQTTADLESALNGVYNSLQSEKLAGGYLYLIPEVMGGNGIVKFVVSPDQLDLDNLTLRSSNIFATNLWVESYKAINLANAVLGALNTVNDASLTPEVRNRIEGEALFIRGYLYFELVRYFGRPYGDQTEENGVPLITRAVLDASALSFPTRATVQEVYGQATDDLFRASTLLPASQGSDRANPNAAIALLARIAFQKGDYTQADGYCKTLLDNPDFKLTASPRDVFTNEESSEMLWRVRYTPGDANSLIFWFHESSGRTGISPELKSAFEDITTSAQQAAVESLGLSIIDLRTAPGMLTSADSSFTNKYEDVAGRADDAPMTRLSEFILMRAETLARSGELQPAIDLLNQIRSRALRIVDSTGEDQPDMRELVLYELSDFPDGKDALIDAIALERRVELCFEGNYFQDQIRLKHHIKGIPYDDCALRLPIPQQEIDANKNLKQHPCY